MAGRPGRSGGSNALSLDEHLQRGTYRPNRHLHLVDKPAPEPVSAAARRKTLDGLGDEGRRVAAGLLSEYGDWDMSSLFTLRQYALSCQRLSEISTDAERRREVRTNLALLRELGLDKR